MSRPPLWGKFVAYADDDLLAFGVLVRVDLLTLAYYHAVQAIEKYLKALALSIIDFDGVTETPITNKWIKTHDLVKLAKRCGESHSYYLQDGVLDNLKRFMEFDQLTRYPWADQKLGNGFSGEDISIFGDICHQLRNDIPIQKDNYKLGMEVRGYFHGDSSRVAPARIPCSHDAVAALRLVVPTIDCFVRGWDISQKHKEA